MDRNNIIGFILIALLLFVYFTFFAPQPVPPAVNPAPEQSAAIAVKKDSVVAPADTALVNALGLNATSPEQIAVLENKDLRVELTSRGGKPVRAELRNYKTYDGNKLELITPASSRFSLTAAFDGRETDLFGLPYAVTSEKTGD